MLYQRKILASIKARLKDKEIVVITGMRRVGKTTLCQILLDDIKSSNKIFLDLENPINQKVLEEKDYDNIIHNFVSLGLKKSEKMYIFLDEIQAAPFAVKAIKYLYDHYDIKFFLTGSSSFYLKNLFPESLSGRKFIFEIFPLDFEEFLIFKNFKNFNFHQDFAEMAKKESLIEYEKKQKYYEEYLRFGGFPGVVLAEDQETKTLRLNDIFQSYFEKDIRFLGDFREVNVLRDFILLLMQRVGSRIEITKISSELGVSRQTIYAFLSFLEKTYFLYLVKPFSRNIDREISGKRKIYLCDTGIINNFAQVNSGSILENAVFLGLKKYGQINYYQKRSGGEIDFILDKKIAFEVKRKGSKADYKKLSKISDSVGIKEKYLISEEFNQVNYCISASDL